MTATICLTLTKRCCLWSCNITWAQAVTLDIVLTILRADVTCQHLQATLGCSVCRNGFTTQLAHHRTDVDNLTMTLLDHTWDNCLRYDEWCSKVDVDYLLEVIYRHLRHRNTLDDTCIIYQDVNNTEFLLDISNHVLHLFLISYITDITLGINTLSLVISKRLIHVMLAAAVESNFCTCLGISLSNSETDTVCGTSYEGNLTLQ